MEGIATTVQRPSFHSSNSNGPMLSAHTPREVDAEMSRQSTRSPPTVNDYFATASTSSATLDTPGPRSPPQMHLQQANAHHPWAELFPKAGSHHGGSAADGLQTPSASSANHFASNRVVSSPSFAWSQRLSAPQDMKRVHSAGSTASSGSGATVLTSSDLERFKGVECAQLVTYLTSDDSEHTLVLDIRPSTSFNVARVRGSINICAPSTLLKRTGVTVERIEEEMLQSEDDQKRFSGWRSGPRKQNPPSEDQAMSDPKKSNAVPVNRIVVLDTDTQNIAHSGRPSVGGGGPCLAGLLRKFDMAGYDGDLRWLAGGFEAFSRFLSAESGRIDESSLLDKDSVASSSTPSRANETDHVGQANAESSNEWMRRASMPNTQNPEKMELRMPPLSNMRSRSLVQPKGLPMEAFTSSSIAGGNDESRSRNCTNIEAEKTPNGNLNGTSQGELQVNQSRKSAANPFFDNIRQNRELQNGITERIPLSIPDMTESEARRLPGFLRKLRRMSEHDRAQALAQAFFEVEREERDRLMNTMQRHADESDCKSKSQTQDLPQSLQLTSRYCAVSPGMDGHAVENSAFPFSIAAALERGGENRYNNIWTYEHSRVRCPDKGGYLNGSYIEPGRKFGCMRRYIATQAPLPSTFETFWDVVWQQNVRTICMTTREFESGRIQSHNYWLSKQYSTLKVELIEEVALDVDGHVVRSLAGEKLEGGQNYFNISSQPTSDDDHAIIRRTLTLTDSQGVQRTITQYQFIAWPDYSVPDEADELLLLIRVANASQHTADMEIKKTMGKDASVGPLVVHCSAGVGRTGTYILIDSVLNIVRQARWAQAGRPALDTWDPGFTDVREDQRSRSDSAQSKTERFDEHQPLQSTTERDPNLRQDTRKRNLKRELSPSGMDIDSRDPGRTSPLETRESSGSDSGDASAVQNGRQVDSPPPARRSRSDEAEETKSKDNPASPSSPRLSSSSWKGGNIGPLSFSIIGPEGPQTPSTALGKLSLSSSQATPSRSRKDSAKESRDQRITHSGQTLTDVNAPSHQLLTQSEVMDPENGIDLVRHVLDTIRQQRMSMVQTTRQFVFAYWAILTGVMDEMRREEAALQRTLSSR